MSTSPAPAPDAGMASQITLARATPVTWRNNQLLCRLTMLIGPASALIGICLLIVGLAVLFPLSHMTVGRAGSALFWSFGAIWAGSQCPRFWEMGRAMMRHQVLMDERGVTFHLREGSSGLFLPWADVAAIKYRRAGNSKEFTVEGKNGSRAIFSFNTFFRPNKLAHLIAERTGLPIQKG